MKNNIWIVEQSYKEKSDYEVKIGQGSAVRYSTSHGYSSVRNPNHNLQRHENFSIRPMPPKAVSSLIKVTGNKNSAAQLKAHLDYISRRGEIEIEDEEGTTFKGDKRSKSITEWVSDFELRKGIQKDANFGDGQKKSRTNRIAKAIVISVPKGADHDALVEATREFAKNNFGGRRYVFAVHSPETEVHDNKITEHRHVHIIVENISPEAEGKLQTDPKVFREWRHKYAEIAKDHGINLEGVTQSKGRPAPHEKHQNVYRLLKKGIIPDRYKEYYENAKSRIGREDYDLTSGERGIIESVKKDYISRERQIDDLKILLKQTDNGKDKLKYSNEIVYLRSVNSTLRMPTNNSQMFMKYAIDQVDRKDGKLKGTLKTVPTVKQYMYAEKLAKAHQVELPPLANVSMSRTADFIKKYGNKVTPKFMSLIQTVAKDRGIKVDEKVLSSHKYAMKWMQENKQLPTVKQLLIANDIAKRFNIDLPKDNSSSSIANFIKEYQSRPSDQMISFAQAIASDNGLTLSKDVTSNKQQLSEFIDKNKNNHDELSPELSKILNKHEARVKTIEVAELENNGQLSPSSIQSINKLIKNGYSFTSDDISNEQNAQLIIQAYSHNQQSERWNKSLAQIETPESVTKSRSKDIDKSIDR
ncbi:relaxase/mobilization nuclease domain-containing protein [Marinicella sp. W31]|uniref:relaxase/mobilization nuclease domain-containing protein n=1 Tax=Marinicella sp. W31 TaxID=3023713 RepID=UPI0037570450